MRKARDPKRLKINEKAEAYHLRRLREMSGERRVKITSEIYDSILQISRAGIRAQNPTYSEPEVEAELRRRIGS